METARKEIAEAARERTGCGTPCRSWAAWRRRTARRSGWRWNANSFSKASGGPRRSPPPWPRSRPKDRRSPGPAASLRAAARALQRLGRAEPGRPRARALDRAEEALAEAETLLTRLADEADADPRQLERAEERLFALRGAARKHSIPVVELPALLGQLRGRLGALESGSAQVPELEAAAVAARAAFMAAGEALGAARRGRQGAWPRR